LNREADPAKFWAIREVTEMSDIARIVDELERIYDGDAWHGPSLRDTLKGVAAAQAAARPIGDAHSIWEILRHIAGWNDVVTRRLEGHPTDEPAEGDFPQIAQSSEAAWAGALANLERSHGRLITLISSLGPERLQETAAGENYSVSFMLHGMVRHIVYHSGQIAILKKMAKA
jgi:uncharacterized damage-inducible protein DinB